MNKPKVKHSDNILMLLARAKAASKRITWNKILKEIERDQSNTEAILNKYFLITQ